MMEANNIFNHSNVTTINTNATVYTCTTPTAVPTAACPLPAPNANLIGAYTPTGAPTFLPTSTLLEARILQFGLKIDF